MENAERFASSLARTSSFATGSAPKAPSGPPQARVSMAKSSESLVKHSIPHSILAADLHGLDFGEDEDVPLDEFGKGYFSSHSNPSSDVSQTKSSWQKDHTTANGKLQEALHACRFLQGPQRCKLAEMPLLVRFKVSFVFDSMPLLMRNR